MKAVLLLLAILIVNSKILISCVGDSMTAGHDFDETCYPDFLRKMLDPEKFQVTNFGHSGTTVQWDSDNPYYKQPNYTLALNSNPNIVIFMFGHNDAKTNSWNLPRFSSDFKKML